jgi:hypothetical protein
MLQRAQRVLNTITDQNMSSMNIVAEDNEAAIEEGEAQDNSGTASVDEGRVRALVIDNQIQGMVLKVRILTGQVVFFPISMILYILICYVYTQESERKIMRMEEMEVIYKTRIEELINENNHLHHRVSEGNITSTLPTIPCFLKGENSATVASEMADFYTRKRSPDSNVSLVPPNILAVGDLQASLQKCCSDFLSNKITLNWHIHKGSTTERGLNIVSGSSYWRLMGTMEGVNGPEMRVCSFETLLSTYLLHHTRNKLTSRDCLRKVCWSVLLWKNKMGKLPETKPNEDKTIFNHQHSDTTSLPRQLREHEKPFVLCISRLFGYFREEPENPAIVHSLYFNLFMRVYSTVQRYIKTPETGSIMISASNLFVPAVASLIPVCKVDAIVRRLFGSVEKMKLYRPVNQRRYSRAVSLSLSEKLNIFGGQKNTRVKRTWWTCLPNM